MQDDVEYAANLFPKVMIEMYAMGLFRFTIIAIFLMFIDWQVICMILCLYIIVFFITLAFNHKTLKYSESQQLLIYFADFMSQIKEKY